MDCTRIARREKAISRAVADDTLGASGAAVKPWKSIVMGGSPYIPCMSPVKLGVWQPINISGLRSTRQGVKKRYENSTDDVKMAARLKAKIKINLWKQN